MSEDIGGENPRFAAVAAVSALILDANPSRKRLVLVQTTGNVVSLAKRDPAVLNSGITLTAAGSTYIEPDSVGRIWKGPWYAIASAASNLAISEDL